MNLKEAEDRIRSLESKLESIESAITSLSSNIILFAENARVANYATSSISASFSDIANRSLIATASLYSDYALSSFSSSYALTASYALNGGGSGSGPSVSSSYAATASLAYTASYFAGSIVSSSYALTASYYEGSTISSSYALSASYAANSISDFPYTGSAIISGGLILSGTLSHDGPTNFSDTMLYNLELSRIRSLGSPIKAETFPIIYSQSGQQYSLTDATIIYVSFQSVLNTTVSSIRWIQAVQGAYTGDNYNGVALYALTGSQLACLASSSNDSEIWKGSANAVRSASLNTTASLQLGNTYYVAAIYNNSAQTTAPQIFRLPGNLGVRDTAVGSYSVSGYRTSQTSFPVTESVSSLLSNQGIMWFALT